MRSLGANLRATRANDFPRQADESEQAAGDQASWRTGSDNLERLTGIYGSDGLPCRAHQGHVVLFSRTIGPGGAEARG